MSIHLKNIGFAVLLSVAAAVAHNTARTTAALVFIALFIPPGRAGPGIRRSAKIAAPATGPCAKSSAPLTPPQSGRCHP